MRSIALLFLLIVCITRGVSQNYNLVSNGSFEQVPVIPDCANELSYATGWFNPCPGISTPDLLSCQAAPYPAGCTWGSANCNHNSVAFGIPPRTGDFMLGMHLLDEDVGWGEYASIKLQDSMKVGQKYYIEYYALPDGKGNCGPQALFTTDTPAAGRYIWAEPQVYSTSELVATHEGSTYKWPKISGVITADHPYSYLTLGNFFFLSEPRQLVGLQWPGGGDTILLNFDYLVDDVKVLPVLKPQLGADRNLCDNDSLTLDAGISASSYIWSTGDTTRNIMIHTGGTYWCGTGNEAGYMDYDTIYINTLASPVINLGDDSAICSSQPLAVQLSPGRGFLRYLWQPTGSTDDTLIATLFGMYSVTVQHENGCSISDTIRIYEDCPDCLSEVTLYPLPTNREIRLQFISSFIQKGTQWFLYDMLGQVCDKGELDISEGKNILILNLFSNLSSGAYIIHINTPCRLMNFKIVLISG